MINTIKTILSSPHFWGIIIPSGIAILTFYITERNKLKWELYKRKEQSYTELIKSAKGFYVETKDYQLKNTFLEQLNICWLYAPDEVIQKGYDFLMSIHTQEKLNNNDKKEEILGGFIAAIRQDMINQKIIKYSKLSYKDFKHLYIRK